MASRKRKHSAVECNKAAKKLRAEIKELKEAKSTLEFRLLAEKASTLSLVKATGHATDLIEMLFKKQAGYSGMYSELANQCSTPGQVKLMQEHAKVILSGDFNSRASEANKLFVATVGIELRQRIADLQAA